MRATVCAMSSTARWMIFELRAPAIGQVWLAFEQRFGVKRHGRYGVVDVVRDAARHLAESAQAFLLHDLLLRGAQVVIGLLKGGVQLRLVRGQRGVFHGLAQEFALAAAEGVRGAPRRDQHAEDLALDQQRRDDQRAHAGARQPRRKRERRVRDVRLVNQLTLDATRQPVLVDGNVRAFDHVEPARHRFGAGADAAHGEPVLANFVQADHAEIDRQFFFDAAHHDLEDAAQVLALADGSRDARHQRQPAHLLAEPRFVLQPLGDVAVVGDDCAHRRVVQQVRGDALEPDPAAVLVTAAPDRGDGLARLRAEFLDGGREGRQIVRVGVRGARDGLTTLQAGNPRPLVTAGLT